MNALTNTHFDTIMTPAEGVSKTPQGVRGCQEIGGGCQLQLIDNQRKRCFTDTLTPIR
jgi:hypothetical protein